MAGESNEEVEVLHMVEVSVILEKLESLGFIRTHRVIGNYQQIFCPFHNDGNERKPSCGVLLHEEHKNGQVYPAGWFHCFACGYAKSLPDAITDLLQLRSISTSGIDWLKENVPGFEGSIDFEFLIPNAIMQNIQNQYAMNYIQLHTASVDKAFVTEEELQSYRYTVPYMYERGLTDSIIEKFDVGVDMKWVPPGRTKPVPCITFPVRDAKGRTLFICRRSISGKMYNYPTGVTKPVYGLDMIPDGCKTVVICESIINALTCWKWGYPAVALLGTGNSYQMQQLRELGVSEYVICMDGDEAGRRASSKLRRSLKSVALIWTINMIEGKDVNDLEKEQFEKLYGDRE